MPSQITRNHTQVLHNLGVWNQIYLDDFLRID